MKCKKCGAEFEGKFCPNCGEPAEKPKKKKKILPKVIIGAVILMGIGAVAGGGEDDTTSSGNVTNTAEVQDTADTASAEEAVAAMSKVELYQALGKESEGNSGYSMSQKSVDFINAHEDLFPASGLDALTSYVDSEIGYKNISKSPDNYGDQIMVVDNAGVISINEEKVGDNTFTTFQAYDDAGENYLVYYFGALPDVFEDDYVKIYGAPLGTTSFDNIGGGTTLAIVLGGSYVEKIPE